MSTINVVAKFFPLAFILYLFPPRVEVDGGPAQKISWNTETPIQVPPGSHHVTVYFPYLFIIPRAGKGETDVTTQEGQTVTVRYKAPWLVFLPGKMKVE
jgi:hypothetical protein